MESIGKDVMDVKDFDYILSHFRLSKKESKEILKLLQEWGLVEIKNHNNRKNEILVKKGVENVK